MSKVCRLLLFPMLFRKLLELNTTVLSQKELSNGWSSVNGLPQWFMSPRHSGGDYAVTVNPQLHVPQYPIPLPEDVFLKLQGGQRFTKLDLKGAYQQLALDPESQQFLTINTHRSLYRYERLPFGIASSPVLFQRTMDIILQGLDHVASIQDDILITGKDDDEHIKNLDSVLSRLDRYGLRLQLSKCKFMRKSFTYMGCVISASGISPTEEKVEAIKQAPRPENLT